MRARSADVALRGGRPKGAPNAKTILRRLAQQQRTVTEAGQQHRLTTVELLLLLLLRKAMAKDLAAAKLFEHYRQRYQPVSDGGGFLVLAGYPGTKEQWLADLKISQDKLWRGTD